MSTAPLGTKRSFHSIRKDSGERAITVALESHHITARDAALIREHLGELKSCSGISDGRVNKNAYIMVGWRRYLGPSFARGDRPGTAGACDGRYRPVHGLRVGEGGVEGQGEGCGSVQEVLVKGGEEKRLDSPQFFTIQHLSKWRQL